ncbi:choice-of-anchor L domain-containing protein [Desulfovibrio sp. X2]|uniref:choice-of-anchor L family PEP-CTERM protein n=1 Tax=Desulfovibrio sp. X2 TaxID=941449 RepID=UPI0012687700|nr:choice-of-anchor L domain-containing protein [Desulfovibrio sp. X2]
MTPTNDANVLVNAILGSGVNIISSSYTGASDSSGTFTGAAGAIGINSGIILTNGQAILAEGPNDQPSAGRDNGLGGTPQLDALSGGDTFDASTLTITFTSTTDNLFFNFVFASEEYNQYVGSFNDVFGFFLDGVNIALLPDNSPVSINNVNLTKNSDKYINNSVTSGSDGPVVAVPKDTQYDGFTTVLSAQALGLGAGEHTISLQIADALDHVLDSGVFIQGGSFSGDPTGPTATPEPGTMILLGSGLVGFIASRRRRTKS